MSEGYALDEQGDDGEGDDYFAEFMEDAELTGKEPRFVAIPEMDVHHSELAKLKVDELIKQYRAVRDQLATDRKGYKLRESKVKTHLMILSMLLRDRGDMAGVDSFKTEAGTAYRNKKESFRVVDWAALTAYIKETGNFSILQKRVSPNIVKEIREVEPPLQILDGDPIPFLVPGLESHVEVEFAVRSPTARAKK